MKIALLGGNSYSYANAPSYVHANGRGCITQRELMGADGRAPTPKEAYETMKYYEGQGLNPETEMSFDTLALAKQYKTEHGWEIADRGMSLLEKGVNIFQDITGQSKPVTDPNAGRSGDNTTLLIVGGVAAVAVIGVILSSKKKRR